MALENLKSTFTEGDNKTSKLRGRHIDHKNHPDPSYAQSNQTSIFYEKNKSSYIDKKRAATKVNHSQLDFDTPLKDVRVTQKESIYRLSKSITGKNNLLSGMELSKPTPSGVNNQSSKISIEKFKSGTNNLSSNVITLQNVIGNNNLTCKRMELFRNNGYKLKQLHYCKVFKWFGMSNIVLYKKTEDDISQKISFDRKVWRSDLKLI